MRCSPVQRETRRLPPNGRAPVCSGGPIFSVPACRYRGSGDCAQNCNVDRGPRSLRHAILYQHHDEAPGGAGQRVAGIDCRICIVEAHEDGRYFVSELDGQPLKSLIALGFTDEQASYSLKRRTWERYALRGEPTRLNRPNGRVTYRSF